MALITLTTDFGLSDAYVASMKGVILGINPAATIIDITHQVPPQDILYGAFVLATAWKSFPKDSIHVAVVDPGVGTARKVVAARWRGHTFVGPDNGLLALALTEAFEQRGKARLAGDAVAHELTNSRYHCEPVSPTFHGRDIFAPAAAHLSRGVSLAKMGPRLRSLQQLATVSPPAMSRKGVIRGSVAHIDIYGNCITNIAQDEWKMENVRAAGRVLALQRTFGDADGPLAYWGSYGYLEIAVPNGHAARELGLKRGDEVKARGYRKRPS
ncbi:MAG: SAM-dependent chlorinase/fluorinase [Chloroflexi bacterium]|nr:SAM-dependent chlorinase/fluorinase [Chloroflexota bacterium]